MDSGGSLPFISVITPVLNRADSIEETIVSVINQSYPNLEYFIVDGGSNDGTIEVIKRYEKFLAQWVSRPDAGAYDGMNTGWKMARLGSYILILGAGDRILSLPVSQETYASADVLYGKVDMGENRVFLPRSDWHLRIYNSLHHQALLVRKSLNVDPPYDVNFKTYADFDLNQRLMKNGAKFRYAEDFRAFALPGGISDAGAFSESIKVIAKNFGPLWCCLAATAYFALRFLPALKKLGPIADKDS